MLHTCCMCCCSLNLLMNPEATTQACCNNNGSAASAAAAEPLLQACNAAHLLYLLLLCHGLSADSDPRTHTGVMLLLLWPMQHQSSVLAQCMMLYVLLPTCDMCCCSASLLMHTPGTHTGRAPASTSREVSFEAYWRGAACAAAAMQGQEGDVHLRLHL